MSSKPAARPRCVIRSPRTQIAGEGSLIQQLGHALLARPTVAALAGRMKDAVDSEAVLHGLDGIRQILEPARLSGWLNKQVLHLPRWADE
jgi:hypothetical protein